MNANLRTSLIGFGCLLLVPFSSNASTLTWSPGSTTGADGSGTWDTGVTSNWSTAGASTLWSSTSDAVIGANSGAAGTITLATIGGVTASSLTFNAPASGNYVLSGTNLKLAGTSVTLGTVGGFSNLATLLTAHTSATVNSTISNTVASKSAYIVDSGATLTFGGGGSLQTGSLNFHAFGQGKMVFRSNTGTQVYNHSGQGDFFNIAETELGNATFNSANTYIGYGATSTFTLTSTASLLNVSNLLEIGHAWNATIGNAKLIVQNGTVTVANTKSINIGYQATGLLNVQGGTVTTPMIYINYTAGNNTSGTLKVEGGTVTTGTIQLGNGTYATAGSATLLMTGGNLDVGVGGIKSVATPGLLAQNITLSGGVIGATADWSSSMAMALGTTNGNITFRAADTSAVQHNIALNGALSGNGGLIKTGAGALNLGGTNSYTGTTTVSEGRLNVNGALSSSSAVNVGTGATLGGSGTASGIVTVTNGSINGSGLTMGATNFHGASTLLGTTSASSIAVVTGTTTVSGTTTTTSGLTVASNSTLKIDGKVEGSVDASGTLGGNGTITGATTVYGSLAPGNSIGTLNTGALTFTADSIFDVELGHDETSAISDRTNVTGAVDIASGTELKLTLYAGLSNPQLNDIFFLISNDGTDDVIGTFNFTSPLGTTTLTEGSRFSWNSQDWQITYKANADTSFELGNDVAIMVVPEPSTWAMLVGGMGLLVFTSRMRRQSAAKF